MLVFDEIEILSIEEIEKETDVYDIEVEEDHSFVVEEIFAHNCLECAGLDGRIYHYGEGEDHDGPLLPLHAFCRCCYSPQTYSWGELAKRHDVEFTSTQRDYFTGKPLDTITYGTWFKTLSLDDQLKILGKTRYGLWKSGKLKLSKMETSKEALSIEQWKELNRE